jgi:hypothetical protein
MDLEELKIALTQLGLPIEPEEEEESDTFDPAYVSVTNLTDSTAIGTEFSPFISTSHAAYVENTNWQHNLTAQGISFDSTTGRFTVTEAGVYEIALSIFLRGGTTTQEDNVLSIKKNGLVIWTADVNTHSSVDPNSQNIVFYKSLAAGDYIEATYDSSASVATSAWAGTTLSIKRIG